MKLLLGAHLTYLLDKMCWDACVHWALDTCSFDENGLSTLFSDNGKISYAGHLECGIWIEQNPNLAPAYS